MTQPIPHHVLYELGCTEGSPATLRLLARDQDRRRLLLLRAVLDAADAAGADRCPPAVRRGLAESWALLEAAERATPDRGATVRSLLLAPSSAPGPNAPSPCSPAPARPTPPPPHTPWPTSPRSPPPRPSAPGCRSG